MSTNIIDIETLIIGAGPGGLATAYQLAKSGCKSLTVEQSDQPGGLMRSFVHGEFTLDIGRKELPGRLSDVDQLWSEVLGADLCNYDRRLGVLYQGKIYETERSHGGLTYGMSPLEFLGGLTQMIGGRLSSRNTPVTYQDQVYRRIGERFAKIFYQGYDQKIGGVRWDQRQAEVESTTKTATTSWRHILRRAFAAKSTPIPWRHPAYGSGQVCTSLHQQAADRGAEFWFDTAVSKIGTEGDRVTEVRVMRGGDECQLRPKTVVSSLPIEILARLLDLPAPTAKPSVAERRSTICVYLFFDEPPRFPHSWLKVTCPRLKAGRVTNYSIFSRKMVPSGKTCLCVEFCCLGQDPLLDESDERLKELALAEVAGADLVDKARFFDHLVRRLPGVDGATDLNDWWNPTRREMLDRSRKFANLYCICQPGTDYASWCGLEAANAIVQGSRSSFDRDMDPAALFGLPG
ncbi:FAD-dependent oxidoreductase [Rubripirellula amarantea]|nr:FAD-dependent oxidoreductase [Rubripirellula amarantea]